jgi:hypothetical protein
MLELFLTIITVFYLLLMYAFLLPAVAVFMFEKHAWTQKGLQVVAFVLGPPIIPFFAAAALMIAILTIVFMVVAYPIYWLHIYLPFGVVFKAWYRISARMLARIREILQVLLELIFPAFLIPAEPKETTTSMPFPVNASSD